MPVDGRPLCVEEVEDYRFMSGAVNLRSRLVL